ncbi:MAG: cache and HAMP domain-containing protein, partial [Pseudomonadota bacterium]
MNFRLFSLQSLNTRVTVFTLAIFLIGIWSLAFYASRMLHEDMQRLLGEQQFSTASILADEVNEELGNRLVALESIAGNVTPALMTDAPAMQDLLKQRPLLQFFFNGGIFISRLDGSVNASIPASAGRDSLGYINSDYLTAILKEGKSTISKPALAQGKHAAIFAMAAPIRDTQGQVIGAVAGVIDLSKPNFLDSITHGGYGKSGAYLIAAPQHQVFVTASDPDRNMRKLPVPGVNALHDKFMAGFEGYGTLVNYRGEEELSAAKGIPVAGWFLALAVPTVEAFSPIRTMQQRMRLATLFLTLLAGGLTWWMLRRQLSPLRVAAKALATLPASGQPSQPLPIGSPDEIGALIGGFNHLLETLGQREAVLRQIMDTSS